MILHPRLAPLALAIIGLAATNGCNRHSWDDTEGRDGVKNLYKDHHDHSEHPDHAGDPANAADEVGYPDHVNPAQGDQAAPNAH